MKRERDPLQLGRLCQVGLVVRDVHATIDYLRRNFGVREWVVFEGETAWCWDRGREITMGGWMAMGWMGRVQLELIQVRGSGSIHADFLEEGREGLHHLGFFVKDLEERLAACRDRGIGVLQRGTLKRMGLTIDYAYLDTVKIGGAIIEFIQTRFLGFNVPQSRLLMKPFSRLQRVFGR